MVCEMITFRFPARRISHLINEEFHAFDINHDCHDAPLPLSFRGACVSFDLNVSVRPLALFAKKIRGGVRVVLIAAAQGSICGAFRNFHGIFYIYGTARWFIVKAQAHVRFKYCMIFVFDYSVSQTRDD